MSEVNRAEGEDSEMVERHTCLMGESKPLDETPHGMQQQRELRERLWGRGGSEKTRRLFPQDKGKLREFRQSPGLLQAFDNGVPLEV